jgi:hypothetical protein
MRQNTRVTFAMRDLDRLKCIQAVVDGDLKLVRASERLGLTTRQVRRLPRRYADFGPTLATEKLRGCRGDFEGASNHEREQRGRSSSTAAL